MGASSIIQIQTNVRFCARGFSMNTEEKNSKKKLLTEAISKMEDEQKIRMIYYFVINLKFGKEKE